MCSKMSSKQHSFIVRMHWSTGSEYLVIGMAHREFVNVNLSILLIKYRDV